MPPKLRCVRMDKDDLAWEKSDDEAEKWERFLSKPETYQAIGNLINKYKPGKAVEVHRPIRGGCNVLYRLEYEDGSSAALRIPCPGIVQFPDEKIRYEVTTMRYVAANTTIPVPKVYHFGTAAENPLGLGPFIIMDYIDHERTMSDALNDPLLRPGESHSLDPNISHQKLEFLYRQIVDIILQLSTMAFPKIGSLNMNSLVKFTSATPNLLPSQTFSTSNEWYSALADMHLAQLTFQHNDAVLDEDDSRDKYVVRQLFRRLASDGRLASGLGTSDARNDGCNFRLFSEDLRPSNVLIDKDLGVIDWEFSYAAPVQFSSDPPWWLLLKSPEYWPGGYVPWMKEYEPRFEVFVRLLEEEEEKLRAKSGVTESGSTPTGLGVPLSRRMRKSWDTKTWMVNYAARNSWVFDFIFWRFLDGAYFGSNDSCDHHARLDLLSPQELDVMGSLVMAKMEEAKVRALVQWDRDGAEAQLERFMV
ncbi:hypothetical protein ACJ41O_010254 [Fusarium nematophilum]